MHKPFKWLVRQALRIFFSRISVKPMPLVRERGPLLVVANHPNSFLDAIVIGACFEAPLYFLARGDAFENPLFRFLLKALHMVPIYRMREGRDQVRRNRASFEACADLLNQGKSILIFIEGICVNQHQLQPFKKGAARLAAEYQGETPLKILPAGIAFENLRGMGKAVNLCFGDLQWAQSLLKGETPHQKTICFNQALASQLQELIEVPPQSPRLANRAHPILLTRHYFNLPFLIFCKAMSHRFTKGTVFYDSVLFALLFLGYPFYLLFWFLFFEALGLSFALTLAVLGLQLFLLLVPIRQGFLWPKP